MELSNLRDGHVVDVVYKERVLNSTALMYNTVGDAAMWTGSYLASQAFRLAASGEEDALEQAENTMSVLELLAQCSSKKGYVVRAAMSSLDPAYAAYYSGYTLGHYDCESPNEGLTWLGDSSRDSYTGFALGLSVVKFALENSTTSPRGAAWRSAAAAARGNHGWSSDEIAVRSASLVSRANALASLVAETLLGDGWWILGPHDAITNPTPAFVTMWQSLALAADPTKFQGKFNLTQSFWEAALVGSYSVHSMFESGYYSNNLMVDTLFVASTLGVQVDPSIQEEVQRLTTDLAVESGTPHLQPTFAAMTACSLLSPSGARESSSLNPDQELLMQGIIQSTLADQVPGPKWMRAVDQSLDAKYFPHHNSKMADHALLAGDRPQGTFQWQQSPANLAGGENSPYHFAAVDRLLPYWAAKFCGNLI